MTSCNLSTASKDGAIDNIISAEVIGITQLTTNSKLFSLKLNGPVEFSAGQYMCFYANKPTHIPTEDNTQIFPGTYSIASPPSILPLLEIAIEDCNNPRNMKHFLYRHVDIGDSIWLENCAYGSVSISRKMVLAPLAWNSGRGGICLIAGGFGIPALVSITKELLATREGNSIPEVCLVHSTSTAKNIPFYEQLNQLSNNHNNFKLIHTVTDLGTVSEQPWEGRTGRINTELLAEIIPGKKIFCVFGSGKFVEAIVKMLLDLGVWPGNIRTDYSTRLDPARVSKHSDKTLAVTALAHEGVDNNSYLKNSGMHLLIEKLQTKLKDDQPLQPISTSIEFFKQHRDQLIAAEVSNEQALNPDFWINYWETDQMKWHSPEVSPWLIKYEQDFLGADSCRRIFVPLCGKSADMKYLLDRGHEVIGSDCSGIACQDFFKEHSIPGYQKTIISQDNIGKVTLHSSTTLPIRLYECDIFDLSPEIIGPIDRILDRAALVALHPSCITSQYLPLLTSLLSEDGVMLMASVSALPEPVAPPHCYTREQTQRLLAKAFQSVEYKMDYCYDLHSGQVVEPIFLIKRPVNNLKSQ